MITKKIAIDGPAGAGKSSLAKAAAKLLGYIYIDTGAMYRAVGYAVISSGKNPKNTSDVLSVIENIKIDIAYTDGEQNVFLGEKNVNSVIRTPEVSVAASDVAVIPEVRKKLLKLQREMAEKNNVIMDGRDIGTRVLPDADVKLFVTASPEERAKRRLKELLAAGSNTTLEEVLKDILYRDKNDSERKTDPLRQAEDSILFDTTGYDVEESTKKLLELIESKDESIKRC